MHIYQFFQVDFLIFCLPLFKWTHHQDDRLSIQEGFKWWKCCRWCTFLLALSAEDERRIKSASPFVMRSVHSSSEAGVLQPGGKQRGEEHWTAEEQPACSMNGGQTAASWENTALWNSFIPHSPSSLLSVQPRQHLSLWAGCCSLTDGCPPLIHLKDKSVLQSHLRWGGFHVFTWGAGPPGLCSDTQGCCPCLRWTEERLECLLWSQHHLLPLRRPEGPACHRHLPPVRTNTPLLRRSFWQLRSYLRLG